MCFQLSDVQVLWLWHHHLTHLNITFSNQRFRNCSPIMEVRFMKLMLDSFCENRVFMMNIQFYSHLWFFKTILLNVRYQCQCWFLPTVTVFPWFMYINITLETVALDSPNNVAVFVTHAPAKHTPTMCPLSKLDKSPFFLFFHIDCHSTQSPLHLHEHYRV
jgi:hypothetical protein